MGGGGGVFGGRMYTESTYGKGWRLYISPQYLSNLTANRRIESHFFNAKFVSVLTALCLLGLKFLELF